MAVQLFTSRIVLNVLGIDDYGIWSLVATLVVSISFITGPLSIATQRFISVEIGGGNSVFRIQEIFSQSIILFIFFSIILFLILETVGLWFLNCKLVIPENQLFAANIVYQLSVLSFIVTLIRMPYNSMIIAYEKMSFFAYVSLVEAGLRLVIVYFLLIVPAVSPLILYGVLSLAVSIVISIIYKIYSNHTFSTSRFKWVINKKLIKEIGAFSGWSLLGAFGVMTANQGVNMVLNIFFGVALNAAVGVCNQVVNAFNQFISSFQLAFQPRLVKTYASGQKKELTTIIFFTSKVSFFLLCLIIIPVIFNIHLLLRLWLKEVPEYSAEFCNWMMVGLVIEAISAPLWMTIQATGNIRNYQILISAILLGNIIGSYILLSVGYAPVSSMWVRVGVAFICYLVRVLYVVKLFNSFILKYIIHIIVPFLVVGVISVIYFYSISLLFTSISHEFVRFCVHTVVFFFLFTITSYFLLLNSQERDEVNIRLRKIIQKI